MSIWDKLRGLLKKQTRKPSDYGPDVVVHHPSREGGDGPVGGGGASPDPGESTPEAAVGSEPNQQAATPPIPPGARMVTGQNVDRYVALTIAQQEAREYCHMDAGLPTIYSTESQQSTVDDGHGHLVPGWEVRIYFSCPGPPIA